MKNTLSATLEQSRLGEFLTVTLFVFTLVSVAWLPCFLAGYFRYDDFAVLSMPRTVGLFDLLFQPHGEHTIAGFRLECALLKAMFGLGPESFNVFALVVFCSAPIATYYWFKREGLSRTAFFLFCGTYVFFVEWYAMLTGYYILTVYFQVTTFVCLAVLALYRYELDGRRSALIWMSVWIVSAAFVDLAGIVVFPILALGWMYLTFRTRQTPIGKAQLWPLAVLVAAGLLLAGYHYAVYVRLHPNVFLVSVDFPGQSVTKTAADLFTVVASGHLANLPGFLWTENRLDLPTTPTRVLAFAVFAFLLATVFHRSDRNRRMFLAWIGGSFLITSLMAAVARPGSTAVKHIAMPYFWYSLLVALTAVEFLRLLNPRARRAAALAIFLFFAIPTIAVPSIRQVREGAIAGSIQRRQQLEDLTTQLSASLASLHSRPEIKVPTIDGRSLFSVFGEELERYDLSFYLDFLSLGERSIQLFRNPWMFGHVTPEVKTTPNLRQSVDPEFFDTLEGNPVLRHYYLAPVEMLPLYGATAEKNPVSTAVTLVPGRDVVLGSLADHAVSELSFWVDLGTEHQGVLELFVDDEFPDSRAAGVFKIGRAVDLEHGINFAVNADGQGTIVVNLNQMPRYALDDRPTWLRLQSSGNSKITISEVSLK